MSARYLTAVVSGGELKVAQYGQSDGYPSWAGVRILEFLSNAKHIGRLKSSLNKVTFLTKSIVRNTMDMGGPNVIFNFETDETPNQENWIFNFFSREVGWRILKELCEPFGDKLFLNNDIAFAGDSLLCEYLYLIDFDNDVLEVYCGHNKTPVTSGRFLSSDPIFSSDDGYEPVRLVKTYKLNDLPENEVFISDIE